MEKNRVRETNCLACSMQFAIDLHTDTELMCSRSTVQVFLQFVFISLSILMIFILVCHSHGQENNVGHHWLALLSQAGARNENTTTKKK